jgi:hypothetical protein
MVCVNLNKENGGAGPLNRPSHGQDDSNRELGGFNKDLSRIFKCPNLMARSDQQR